MLVFDRKIQQYSSVIQLAQNLPFPLTYEWIFGEKKILIQSYSSFLVGFPQEIVTCEDM